MTPAPLPASVLGSPERVLAMSTIYTVQCFQLKGGKLVADPPKSARTAEAAVEIAERLGGGRAGAVAFSQDVDIGTDTYDEPRVLCRVGSLPRGLFEDQ